MKRAPMLAAAATTAGIVALGGAWFGSAPVQTWWWRSRSARPLSEEESRLIAACEDPGWTGLLKVVTQQVPTTCEPRWLTTQLANQAHGRHLTYLRDLLADPERLPGQRLTLGIALWQAGAEPLDLPFYATDPALSEADRAALAAWIAADPAIPGWVDPLLQSNLALQALTAGGGDPEPEHVAMLAWASLDGDPVRRAAITQAVLGAIGVAPADLVAWEARLRIGRTAGDLPAPWIRLVRREGAACADPGAPACLQLAASLVAVEHARDVEGWTDWERGHPAAPDAPPPGLVIPLWTLQYGAPDGVQTAASMLGAFSSWIADSPEGLRGGRLLGLVADPRHGHEASTTGDVLAVLRDRGGSPWASATAAVALGASAGVPITVGSSGELVVISAGSERIALDRCGRRAPPPTDAEGLPIPVAGWPDRAIAAQATLEAALAAQARGNAVAASALAQLAHRLDSAGATWTPPAPTDASMLAGFAAGNSLAVAPAPPVGAEADRARVALATGALATCD